MKRTYYIILLAIGAVFFTACKKDLATYQDDPRVYFFEVAADINATVLTTRNVSLATLPATQNEDTIYIRVKTMGLPQGKARSFAAVATGGTATAGTHYRLLTGSVPANSVNGTLPVVLIRTPDIKTASKTVQLKIADSLDFKGGVVEYNQFTVNWTENVIKPDNWETIIGLKSFFGVYSEVKWRFIISVLGRDYFPLQQTRQYDPNSFTNGQMADFAARLKEALLAYNNANNPDLTDEFGNLVTFP